MKISTFSGWLLVLFSACLGAQPEQAPPEPESTPPFGLMWLDQTQAYASTSANSLATQLDRFFGVPRSDLEAAYSSLRLTFENSWYELDNNNSSVKLRGKIHLPRLNERISLIFSEDSGDGSSYYQSSPAIPQEEQSTRANLEYNLRNRVRDRLDFRLGLRSSLKLRASVRYRYELPTSQGFLNRFTQTLYHTDSQGFGAKSRYQLEKSLSDDSLLRWNNDIEYEEELVGSKWLTGLSYNKRLSEKSAISYYTSVTGYGGPARFTESYNVGVRLRRNIDRPWFFMELEPGYSWRKLTKDNPREGQAFLTLRFEMAIGKLD